jgi:WhiB family transcriptional regulator, redox-sensing transcriptional regulator
MTALALAPRDWRDSAVCRGSNSEIFFPFAAPGTEAGRRQTALAISFCSGCPVRTECLADALGNGIEFGVWGGTAETERQALTRPMKGAA